MKIQQFLQKGSVTLKIHNYAVGFYLWYGRQLRESESQHHEWEIYKEIWNFKRRKKTVIKRRRKNDRKREKAWENTTPTLGQKKNNKRSGSYHPATLDNYQETKSNNS